MSMVGKTIAHYAITDEIGRGGMGEVYLATDTKLKRQVAVKVLSEALSGDEQHLARLTREAEVLASLDHPGIAQIHGIEDTEGGKALVLQLIEGPTLADRIKQGPMPVDEALPVALQIAEALEAAHEKGIIHRDLKPANIKITPEGKVKILDFGLAKAVVEEKSAEVVADSPTLTMSATRAGIILGTPAYMSPEQASGRPVDGRADIWAFGAVLYEMLSGTRAFPGEDWSETISRVIGRQPDWDSLPTDLPPGILRLLRRCLRKEPKKRLHHIADARLEIEENGGEIRGEIVPTTSLRSTIPWGIAFLMTVAAGASLYISLWHEPPPSKPRAHLQIVLPEGLNLAVASAHPALALSPDGSRLVFVADNGSVKRLYIRDLSQKNARPIAGTEGAASPFFSPDGEWIGFFSGNDLMKVSTLSGAPVAAHSTTAVSVNRGATWLGANDVVMAPSANSGLTISSLDGDQKKSIREWKTVTEERAAFSWPHAIPNGRSVVFTDDTGSDLDAGRIALLSVDEKEVESLGFGGTNPRYSNTGHVLYGRASSLYAFPFDGRRKERTGPEFKVLDRVMSHGNGAVQYAVGGNGTLAYISAPSGNAKYELTWVDRNGRPEMLFESPQPLFAPRLSPDGTQVAVTIVDGSNIDVWLFDLRRRTMTRRLTTHPGEDFGAVWHPQGKAVALASEVGENRENPGPELAWIADIAAGGPPEVLLRTPGDGNWDFPASWSRDGQRLAFVANRGEAHGDILFFPMSAGRGPLVFLESPADEYAPMLSPDGRWLAYVSDDTGRDQIYVQIVSGPGARTQISSQGGTEPIWSRDGRELFYREGNRFMATRVDGSGRTFVAEDAKLLFEGPFDPWEAFGARAANYDISPDGTHFVVARRKSMVTARVIDVVLNWARTTRRPLESH